MFRLLLFLALALDATAQISRFPTGANRSDVDWRELTTEHFVVVYHDGLDSVARVAAAVAEAVYPVVTGNLGTEVSGRTRLFLSDLDDVPNAFAFDDDFIYIWMRGIVDDVAPAGIRASGRTKWLRSVITHELTHIVIAHATRTWIDVFVPVPDVPRWFNEGTARAMEPDPWTTDLDMALRVAAVNGRLGYNLFEPGVLDGTLLYETGHSLVRYMLWRFGDSVIARILDAGHGFPGYDFEAAVATATGSSLARIRADWFRAVTAMYAAEYAGREEVFDVAPAVTERFESVFGARFAPDRRRIAILGSPGASRPSRLYVMTVDDSLRAAGAPELLLDEPGVDAHFSWSPDGRSIAIAKLRYGTHRALVSDLYVVDAGDGSMRRISSDASLRDPAWSPDGSRIVAIRKRIGRDELVLVDPSSGAERTITRFDADVQMHTPAWSPDGSRIAFGLFDTSGIRSIATVGVDDSDVRVLTNDTTNDRYPVWSPDGRRIAFTSHADGFPNVHVMNADGSDRHAVTAVAGGLSTVQWARGDTLMVLSFDTRDRIAPRLVPTSRIPRSAPPPRVLAKFTAWRETSFSRTVPEAGAIAAPFIVDSGGYVALLNLQSVAPLLPVGAEGVTRVGRRRDRAGLGSLWFDPMAIHLLYGYVELAEDVDDLGAELFYQNNVWPFTATLHLDYSLAYRRRIDGRRYFERTRGASLELAMPFAAPDALDIGHHIIAGVSMRGLEPWNGPEFVIGGHALEERPRNATLAELTAGYRFGAPRFFVDARYRRAEPALGSDLAYHRLSATASVRIPILVERELSLLARVDGAAHVGETLPQEKLRLDEDDALAGHYFNPIVALAPTPNYRVRGVRSDVSGDRVFVASVGAQTRFPFFEDLVPLLTLFRPQGVIFVDAGSAWHADRTPLDKTAWFFGAGAELRAELLPRFWLSLGVAHAIGRGALEWDRGWDLYIRYAVGL